MVCNLNPVGSFKIIKKGFRMKLKVASLTRDFHHNDLLPLKKKTSSAALKPKTL